MVYVDNETVAKLSERDRSILGYLEFDWCPPPEGEKVASLATLRAMAKAKREELEANGDLP